MSSLFSGLGSLHGAFTPNQGRKNAQTRIQEQHTLLDNQLMEISRTSHHNGFSKSHSPQPADYHSTMDITSTEIQEIPDEDLLLKLNNNSNKATRGPKPKSCCTENPCIYLPLPKVVVRYTTYAVVFGVLAFGLYLTYNSFGKSTKSSSNLPGESE